ncbi:MAG TPA: sugar phosphate nucleotidyltransferase [Myxococcota bacterium]|jgi:glucose-1-phosphate thymidylyltransferase|nr:sugar phosphate nucleotidyltransferase [Myxococcota bacterium]
MRGVVLAGGTGSRLHPLTKVTNKHLLPVGREPMVFHPLRKLREAGIREAMVVTGVEHMGDVVRLLGSGRELGMELTYRVQDEAGGIAQALGLARAFAAGEGVCVLLGDNVFQDSIGGAVERFGAQGGGARLLLKEVPDPQRYGVAKLADDGKRIELIIEKPKEPPSALAVTGIYLYDSTVFDLIRGLKPSGRGELEITDVNNAYVERGACHFEVLHGWWTDAGTFPSWRHANELAFDTWGDGSASS